MNDNVNKKISLDTTDSLGRSLSNILTSIPLPDYQLNNIDVFQQDFESGYTPLHQALNSGYIYKAFLLNESFKRKNKKKRSSAFNTQSPVLNLSRDPWKLKDNDGLTPLELYMNKFFSDSTKLAKYVKNKDTSSLYGFGKIINIELGFGNNNDSLKQFDLNGLIIDDIKMSNSRVLLVDNDQRLYMFKLKHIGKMIETCSFNSFLEEPYPGKHFLKTVISNTHSIATTDTNELIIFGDNEYGQCSMAPTSASTTGNILFISCSNVSSSIINSRNELISWGLNTGQFGSTEINCSNNKKINFNNVNSYLAKKFTVIDLPDSLGDIKQLIQLDYVTFILHGDNGLLVLSNFKKYHFYIPPLGTKEHSFNTKVSSKLTLGNKVEKIHVKDPFGNNIIAKFENGILGHFNCNTTDSTNIWRYQLFQLPFKILYKPENNLLANYHVQVSDSKDNLKSGLLNFFGDYFYISSEKSPYYEHKMYHKLLQGTDCLISDPDCNNFLVLKKDYNFAIENVNQYRNIKSCWMNCEESNEKIPIKTLKMKKKTHLPIIYKSHDNFDLEIVDFENELICKLHKFVLNLLAPNNILFSSELFQQINSNKLKYLSRVDDEIASLKDCILYFYTGEMKIAEKLYQPLNSIFKLKEIVTLNESVSKCINTGSIEITTKTDSLFCQEDILKISSPIFFNLFNFTTRSTKVDFSNFEKESIIFLLKYFHLFDIENLLNVEGKRLTVNNLCELICLSDYLMLSDLKNYIEYLISCSHINSKNFVSLVILANNYTCESLFAKLCDYLFLNIAILFENEIVIQDIKENFTFQIWEPLDKKLRSLMKINDFDDSKCWYRQPDFKELLKIYNTDLNKWNIKFNDRFKIEHKKKFSANNNNRKTSLNMSRSASSQFNAERPNFTDPWDSYGKKNTTPASSGSIYSSVFDDEGDATMEPKPYFSYKQENNSISSQESFGNAVSVISRKEDEFVVISKYKKTNKTKSMVSQIKAKDRPLAHGMPAKVVPGSQPLKTIGKRRASNNIAVNQKPPIASNTKIPTDIIKPGPELPKSTASNGTSALNSDLKQQEISMLASKLPTLSTISLNNTYSKKKVSTDKKNGSYSGKSNDLLQLNESKTGFHLSLKDSASTKVVSSNMSLEDMLLLAKKENKKSSSNSVWFQDTKLISKTVQQNNFNVIITQSSTESLSSARANKSSWDYTKKSSTISKTMTLEEMIKSTKKK
ncbi:hypothetical protein QEN19_003657 [Hanseniaspora menglaensis]